MEDEEQLPPVAVAERTFTKAEIHAVLDLWWRNHMHGSPLGRETEVWNYVHGAFESLKAQF